MPERPGSTLRYIGAALFMVVAIGGMALYPTVIAVCILPGWRTFFEAFAVSYAFCLGLLAFIIVMVARGH